MLVFASSSVTAWGESTSAESPIGTGSARGRLLVWSDFYPYDMRRAVSSQPRSITLETHEPCRGDATLEIRCR